LGDSFFDGGFVIVDFFFGFPAEGLNPADAAFQDLIGHFADAFGVVDGDGESIGHFEAIEDHFFFEFVVLGLDILVDIDCLIAVLFQIIIFAVPFDCFVDCLYAFF